MSTTLVYAVSGVIAFIVLLTILMILTRYKKCKSNELLVVYGKTKGNTASKCYHGGSAFVWPVIQGYSIMSMDPFQIQCDLNGALSSQKIEVNVPTVVTVAVSTKPEIMQNAAVRLLGLNEEDKVDQIKDVIWGQLRLIIAEMSIEDLISERDKFLNSCKENIATELEKFGLELININISDISDRAEYIKNLGLEAASKAKYEAQANIEKRTKEGEVGIATQKKEKEIQLSEITRDKEIAVAENKKQEAIKTTEIEKEKLTITETTKKEQDIALRDIERDKAVQIAEVEKNQEIETANLEREQAEMLSQIERDKQITVATNESVQAQKVAEQEKLRDSEVAKQHAEAQTQIATFTAQMEAEIAEQESKSNASQAKSRNDAAASVVESEQEAESRKIKAERQREAEVTEYESEKRQRQANANRDAKLTENNSGIDVAKSDAMLGKETAEAQKIIGLAQVESEKAVEIAKAQKNAEIAKEKAKAHKEQLEADIMVGTGIERDRKIVEAEGLKQRQIKTAEGEAEAIKIVAQAKAEEIRLTKLAQAEGEEALAKVQKILESAKSESLANLANAGVAPEAQISWILKDSYAEIVEAESKRYEHLTTGDIKIIGGTDTAGKFIKDTVQAVQSSSMLSDFLPGLGGILGKLDKFDKKNQIQQPEPEGDSDK